MSDRHPDPSASQERGQLSSERRELENALLQRFVRHRDIRDFERLFHIASREIWSFAMVSGKLLNRAIPASDILHEVFRRVYHRAPDRFIAMPFHCWWRLEVLGILRKGLLPRSDESALESA